MTDLTRRNFILGSLGTASMFSIAGCGSMDQSSDTQQTTEGPQGEVSKYVVGDTIETDLVKLTLDNACFALALGNSLPVGCDFKGNTAYGSDYSGLEYFAPKEYSAEDDSDNPFIAPKGSILVYVEMMLECLDRDSLEVDASSNDDFVTLHYGGSDYTIGDNSGSFASDNKEYGVRADTEGNWEELGVSNLLLTPASTNIYRAYYCYPVEPESLDEPFEITFALPKSDDTTEFFTFAVSQ